MAVPELKEIVNRIGIDFDQVAVTPLGSGNINDTYLIKSKVQTFVLQRINSSVFPKPEIVIENFFKITRHLQHAVKGTGEELLFALPVTARDGQPYLLDRSGGYWRAQSYIPGFICPRPMNKRQARSVGNVLARFHLLLSELDPDALKDPLPGFHDIFRYLKNFDRAWKKYTGPTDNTITRGLECIDHFMEVAESFEGAKNKGILPVQPVHGDPKADNFIFTENGRALGLLDLDTVSSGLLHHDLGDCLRSCCNLAGEAAEGRPPKFNLELCQWILEGYFGVSEKLMDREQAGYIFDGIIVITFELGLRFFIDHLQGNRYFKVQEDGDNLRKADIQFSLAEDIAAQKDQIRGLISSILR